MSAVNKIAEVTFVFWVMKICATTLGETAGDLLSMTLNVGYATSTLILLTIFLVTLIAQLKSKTFHPYLYWTVILATSTAGTTMSDFMDRTLGLGYATGAAVLSICLVICLLSWRHIVGSLSVNQITTQRSEIFYWVTILFSNTLGTALGDYLADDSGLGFLGGALLVGGIIAITALLYKLTRISHIILFWIAFVLTRPLGATFGDLLTKDKPAGLGFGTTGSSIVLALILMLVVIYASRTATATQLKYIKS